MSNDPEDTNNTNLSSKGSNESTLGVLQSLFAQDEGVDQEQEQVKEWEQPTGDDLRSRLAIITNDIHLTLNLYGENLETSLSSLNKLLWNYSNEARLTFVNTHHGLETVRLVLESKFVHLVLEDEVAHTSSGTGALMKVLDTVSALGSGKCELEDRCVHVGIIGLVITFLRFPVSEVRAEAASALGTILGDSLLARKLVLSPAACGGALDSLQSLLDSDSDDERSYAVYSLFNSFRHMSAEDCKMITERFGGQIAGFAGGADSSDRLVSFSCGFISNCFVLPESYLPALNLGLLSSVKTAFTRSKTALSTPHHTPTTHTIVFHSVRTFRMAACYFPQDGITLDSHKEVEVGLLPYLGEILKDVNEGDCVQMGIMALTNVAGHGLCVEELDEMGIFDELENIAMAEKCTGMLFNACLRFAEGLIHYDEESAKGSFRTNLFLDKVAEKASVNMMTFRDTREDPTNVLELTLQGLVEPLNHRLFRRKVIRAGGAEQIHHLCKKWVKTDEEEEGDEPRFPLETLQIVNNLSLDKDVCETFYELGTVEVLCDVINRVPNHLVWVIRCINSIMIDSPPALTYLETRSTDLIPTFKSALGSPLDSPEGGVELVLRTASAIASCLKSPTLHKCFLEAEFPRILIDMATSSPDVSIMGRAYWTLNQFLETTNEHRQETLNIIFQEQALSRTKVHVFSRQNLSSDDLSTPMQFARTLVRRGELPSEDIESLVKAIIEILRRYDDFNCVLWFYAFQSLDSLAETETGREAIFSLDPSLQLLKDAFTQPTLAPDWQIQAITCILLWTLNDDERLIPLVVEHGFIPFLLTFLPSDDGLWRRNASNLLARTLCRGEANFQAVIDAGLISVMSELLSSTESLPLEHAFTIISGCPPERRKWLLAETDLHDKVISLLRSETLPAPIRAQTYEFVTDLWAKDPECREELSRMGLISLIKTQLKKEVENLAGSNTSTGISADGKEITVTETDGDGTATAEPSADQNTAQPEVETTTTENEEKESISSRSAVNLLSSLPLGDAGTSNELLGEGILEIFAPLLWHRDAPLAKAVLRATYRLAAEGTTEIREAIIQHELEGLVRLHAHAEYSTHAEAAQAISELNADEPLRPDVISRLSGFLGAERDDVLLSTTLLVLEDLLGTYDKDEAAANASEMVKINIQSKVEELTRHASRQVNSRALRVAEGLHLASPLL